MIGTITRYIRPVFRLTRQEQTVVCVVVCLLLVGWAVKAWRMSRPAPAASVETTTG